MFPEPRYIPEGQNEGLRGGFSAWGAAAKRTETEEPAARRESQHRPTWAQGALGPATPEGDTHLKHGQSP